MKFRGNLVSIGALLVFGLLAAFWDDVSQFLPEGTKYLPPGSEECLRGGRGANLGCFITGREPLEGIAQVLA